MRGRQQDRQQDEADPHRPRRRSGSANPASSDSMQAGADNVRRRLSSIFQRPIAGTASRGAIGAGDRSAGRRSTAAAASRRAPSGGGAGGDVVAGGKLLDDLDIGGEPGAGEDAFEQIVAEQGRVGHPAGQRRLESVDVVDALAGVGAFAEEILVHIGDRGGIRVDAVHAGKHALEQRTLAADRQRGRDPRLQHGIARDDPPGGGIEARPVERMRHLADQAVDRVARQPRVGVERDDVADVGGHGWRLPADG